MAATTTTSRTKGRVMTDTSIASTNHETALLSIGYLNDMTGRLLWNTGGGRGLWESCLATLVLAFEPNCKARRLVEALPAEKNMNRTQCLNAMANLGYTSQPLDIRLGDIEQRLLPCLFTPDTATEQPVVILSRKDDSLTIYDSKSHSIRTIPTHSADAAVHGAAFFFQRHDRHAEATSKFMRQGTSRTWFSAVVRRFSGSLWQIFITCIALNIFALAPALFIMVVYDRVISPADTMGLTGLAAGVALALAAEWYLRDIRSEGLAWLTARLDNLVGSKIFAQLIGLPASMIENASVSAQVARIRTFESVRDFFSSAVFLSFLEIPFVIFASLVIWAVAGPLVLVPLGVIACYAALFFAMRHKIMTTMRIAAKASSARQQFIIETVEKLPGVRINGLSQAWEKKYDSLSGREIVMNFQLAFQGTVAETLAHALTVMAAVLTIAAGAHLIWAGAMTTGALVASMILVWRILIPFYSLCTMIPRLEQLRNSIIQVNSLMDLDTESDMATAVAALPALKGTIHFDHAVLRYSEHGSPVIDGLNCAMTAGQFAVITGRNGTGKSSVLKMVKGLYAPEEGMVRIDGFDIRQMEPAELRRQIAYVPQKPDFFPGTLCDNLVIGNPFASIDDVESALKRACAWEETRGRLHEPLDPATLNNTLAARLSLARAYVQDARIILIDEMPNAVLNGVAGRNLKIYLTGDEDRKRTAIMVTHRGDFMEMADIVIRLDHNEPPLAGSRKDMMRYIREAA
jgi:ABC-type bacteriocin/lantibiotic exporter with double-glycine peptidase domain